MHEAVSGGTITGTGGSAVTVRGICWSIGSNPTSQSFDKNGQRRLAAGTGTGSFSGMMTGLLTGTVYYVRAYAINSAGTAYGDELSFTTLSPISASVETQSITDVTGISASVLCEVTNEGGSAVSEKGSLLGTLYQTPDTTNAHLSSGSSGLGSYTITAVRIIIRG